jgi:uncharacterized membrane protein YsdA (DUF1294 family)
MENLSKIKEKHSDALAFVFGWIGVICGLLAVGHYLNQSYYLSAFMTMCCITFLTVGTSFVMSDPKKEE